MLGNYNDSSNTLCGRAYFRVFSFLDPHYVFKLIFTAPCHDLVCCVERARMTLMINLDGKNERNGIRWKEMRGVIGDVKRTRKRRTRLSDVRLQVFVSPSLLAR